MLDQDLKAISTAVELIKLGSAKRVDLGHGMTIYKVPSNSPNKYTIRLDIHIDEEVNQ